MINGILIQGTTPEHEFTIPFDTSLIEEIRISYGQKDKEVLVKDNDACSFNGNVIKTTLSQEDTFLFNTKSNVTVQIRILTTNGQIHTNDDEILLRVKGSLNSEAL